MKTEQNNKILPKLLSIKKASIYSGLTIWTIRQLIWAGKIPVVCVGRTYYIATEDIDKWIIENKTYQT